MLPFYFKTMQSFYINTSRGYLITKIERDGNKFIIKHYDEEDNLVKSQQIINKSKEYVEALLEVNLFGCRL